MAPPRPLTRSIAGALLLCSTFGAPLLVGCDKSGRDAPVDPSPADGRSNDAGPALAAGARAPVELIHIEAHVHEIDGMLAAVDEILASWTDEGGTWKARAQAILLSTGYGPGLLDALDLKGQVGARMDYPHPGQAHAGPTDASLAVSIPTKDNRALIDAMPGAYRPQPMGEGMWQLIQGELRYLLRETPSSMQVGFEPADLDRAAALVAEPAKGRRIKVKAWNIPKDDIDPNAVLGGGRGDFSQRLGDVIQDLESMEGEVDLGSGRDLQVVGRVDAPFDRLPLEMYGAPLRQPSEVAGRLPPGAAWYTNVSWGDPTPLHRGIKRLVEGTEVPPPFDSVVKDVVKGAHDVLDGLSKEIVFAVYVDDKDRGTVLVGGKIADPKGAQAGVRSIFAATERALSAHIALVGDEPDSKYEVKYKKDGVSLPGGKADSLVITVPKYMQDEADDAALFLGKKRPQVEVIAFVANGYGFVAVGTGSRQLMSTVARGVQRAPAKSLESDGGLALAREASDGCAICTAINVKQAARLAALVLRDTGDDDAAAKALLADTNDLEIEAPIALGASVEGRRGTLALGVSKALLFADRKQTRRLEALYTAWSNGPPPPAPKSP